MSIVIVENIKQVKKRAKLDRRNLSFCQFDFQKCASAKKKNNEEYTVLMGILCFIANNVDDHT